MVLGILLLLLKQRPELSCKPKIAYSAKSELPTGECNVLKFKWDLRRKRSPFLIILKIDLEDCNSRSQSSVSAEALLHSHSSFVFFAGMGVIKLSFSSAKRPIYYLSSSVPLFTETSGQDRRLSARMNNNRSFLNPTKS